LTTASLSADRDSGMMLQATLALGRGAGLADHMTAPHWYQKDIVRIMPSRCSCEMCEHSQAPVQLRRADDRGGLAHLAKLKSRESRIELQLDGSTTLRRRHVAHLRGRTSQC
jgi:hypothetical protein